MHDEIEFVSLGLHGGIHFLRPGPGANSVSLEMFSRLATLDQASRKTERLSQTMDISLSTLFDCSMVWGPQEELDSFRHITAYENMRRKRVTQLEAESCPHAAAMWLTGDNVGSSSFWLLYQAGIFNRWNPSRSSWLSIRELPQTPQYPQDIYDQGRCTLAVREFPSAKATLESFAENSQDSEEKAAWRLTLENFQAGKA